MAEQREAGVGVRVAAQRGELGGEVVEAAGHLAAVRPLRRDGPGGGEGLVEPLRALALPDGEHGPPAGPGVVVGRGGQGATGLHRVVERLQRGGQARAGRAVAERRGHGEQRHLPPAGGVAAGRGGSRCVCKGVVHDGNASAALARPRAPYVTI